MSVNQIKSPFLRTTQNPDTTAAPAATQMNTSTRLNVGSALAAKYQHVVDSLEGSAQEDLAKVLNFLNNSYGSGHILEYATIDDSGHRDLQGRVVLDIPEAAFFGDRPGYFQLRLSWPKLDKAGDAIVKVTLNYRIGADGNNILLAPGAGTGERDGWTNISSQRLNVQHLIEAGFFAPACIKEVLTFVNKNMGNESGIKTLTPQSDVRIVLRNTIVPPTEKQDNSRNIVTTKAAGSDAGLGMSAVHFQGATILSQAGGLLLGDNKDKVTAKVSFAELMARFGVGAPVATPNMGAQVDKAHLTNEDESM
jgi:hypothetical protein